MNRAKRTYTLPPELLQRFESRTPPGERSGSLARILEGWLADQEREELRARILAGCREMTEEFEPMDREWAPAADEVWSRNEQLPERRRGSCPAGSGGSS